MLRANSYIDWSSPYKLILSNIDSLLDKMILSNFSHNIGHTYIAYGSSSYMLAFGQTGQNSAQEKHLIYDGFGFTALTNIVYTDGRLQESDEIIDDLELSIREKGSDNVAWLTFLVNDNSIQNMDNFIINYKKNNAFYNYGFPVDPKKYEGGGCASFVNAALDASGIDFPIVNELERTIYMPWKLLGYNEKTFYKGLDIKYMGPDIIKQNNYKVAKSLSSMMNIFYQSNWGEVDLDYKFSFYDPELFYRSLIILENYYAAQNDYWFYKEIYANDKEQTSRLKNILKPYYIKNNLNIYIDNIDGVTGLIIDLRDNITNL